MESRPAESKEEWRFKLRGLTCGSCVNHVKTAVTSALSPRHSVSVTLNPPLAIISSLEQLPAPGNGSSGQTSAEIVKSVLDAVQDAGKEAALLHSTYFSVDGMTCQNCVGRVQKSIDAALSDSTFATVSLQDGIGLAVLSAESMPFLQHSSEVLLDAVKAAGKTATVLHSSSPSQHFFSPDRPSLVDIPVSTPQTTEQQDILPASIHNRNLVKTVVRVEGMTCASCVSKVEDILGNVPGVQEVSVNLMAGQAVVVHSNLPVDCLTSVIETSGYKSGELRMDPNDSALYLVFTSEATAESAKFTLEQMDEVQSVAHLANQKQPEEPVPLLSPLGLLRVCAGRSPATHQEKEKTVLEIVPRKNTNIGTNSKISLVNHMRTAEFGNARFDLVSAAHPAITGSIEVQDRLANETRQWFALFLLAMVFFLPLFLVLNFPPFHRWLAIPLASTNIMVGEVVALLLSTPIIFLCGAPFYRNSYYAIFKRGRANMDVLVCLGSGISFATSASILISEATSAEVRTSQPLSISFGSASMLVTFVLFGKWMESAAKAHASDGLAKATSHRQRHATLLRRSNQGFSVYQSNVEIELLMPDDLIQVAAGEFFPADCELLQGSSDIDESMLTGESNAVVKTQGDFLYCGTLNCSSTVVARVTTSGSQTVLSKILESIVDSQNVKSAAEGFADRIAAVFVPAIVSLSILVFATWYILSSAGVVPPELMSNESSLFFSLTFALSVLVVACPCAFGLATPTVVMVVTGTAASRVRSVIFDKTGTLTTGALSVSRYWNVRSDDPQQFQEQDEIALEVLASLETYSEHPIAKGLVSFVADRDLRTNLPVKDVNVVGGRGITGEVHGYSIVVGLPKWVTTRAVATPRVSKLMRELEKSPASAVLVAVDGQIAFGFLLSDSVRPESAKVVDWLESCGIESWMVTGDSHSSASHIASLVGIPESRIRSEALPWQKAEHVKTVIENSLGGGVAFVGDGINDAPALAAASIGIALGSGVQVSAEAADVVVCNSNIGDVAIVLDFGRRAQRRIQMNYFWALAYNAAMIPLAAGVTFPLTNIRIPPHVAAAAMAMSSISVVLSSLLLRRYRAPFARRGSNFVIGNHERKPVVLNSDQEEERSRFLDSPN